MTGALLEAAVKVRRRGWQDREIPLEDDGWAQPADRRSVPDAGAESGELLDAVSHAIAEALPPHQRTVLIAVTLTAYRSTSPAGALVPYQREGPARAGPSPIGSYKPAATRS